MMIGQHPEMTGLPETNLFAADNYQQLSRLYSFRPRFQHGLLRAIAELGLDGQTGENIEVAKVWLEENSAESTAVLFEDLVDWTSPRNVVEKSPVYTLNSESLVRIKRAFPDALYLHLIRHPRPNCESVYKLRTQIEHGAKRFKQRMSEIGRQFTQVEYRPDAELTPETMWLKPHLNIIEFLEGVPQKQHIRIRGEDLLSDPDLYLPQIAEWLEIRTDSEAIDAMQHPERSPFACYGPLNARFGSDPDFLESPAFRPYHPKPQSLDQPLSWDSGLTFDDTVKHYAVFFGY
jgi:hypothetical protein